MTYKNTRRGGTQIKRGGFTLIELLVVVLIIGILAAMAVSKYQKAVLKTRYVQAQVLGRTLQEAVKMYYLANGAYPISLENLDIQFEGKLSDKKNEITFDGKYTCYLDVRNNSLDSLWCNLVPPPNGLLSYRVYLNGRRFCVAKGSTNEEICKAVGGKNPFDNGTGLIHYQLP